LLNHLKKIRRKITFLLKWVIIIIFLMLISIVSFQIVARYFTSYSISRQSFSTEISGYLLVYLTFLGASLATERDEHMRIDFFVELLSKKIQRIFKYFTNLVYFLVCLVLFVQSIDSTIFSFKLGSFFDTLPIPVWIIYFVFPLAFILMMIFILIDSLIYIKEE